jgi:hypothetical protein
MTQFSSLFSLGGPTGAPLRLRFEQSSARLDLFGLPDVTRDPETAADSQQRLGILTRWELAIGQQATLEGRLDHLQGLLEVVLTYVRRLISSSPRHCGGAAQRVEIEPREGGHLLTVHSSQPDTPPLRLVLDSAELADLTQCLDQMLNDPRIGLPLVPPAARPLPRRDLPRSAPLAQRLLAPTAAAASLLVTAALVSLVPLPRPEPGRGTPPTEATPSARGATTGR